LAFVVRPRPPGKAAEADSLQAQLLRQWVLRGRLRLGRRPLLVGMESRDNRTGVRRRRGSEGLAQPPPGAALIASDVREDVGRMKHNLGRV
jgi:hypothetical protein